MCECIRNSRATSVLQFLSNACASYRKREREKKRKRHQPEKKLTRLSTLTPLNLKLIRGGKTRVEFSSCLYRRKKKEERFVFGSREPPSRFGAADKSGVIGISRQVRLVCRANVNSLSLSCLQLRRVGTCTRRGAGGEEVFFERQSGLAQAEHITARTFLSLTYYWSAVASGGPEEVFWET